MEINKAIYIKLGESGCFEKDSIDSNKIRFRWKDIPIDLIKNNDWVKINKLIADDFQARGKKNGAKNDYNALKNICTADDKTVFITFYSGKMYWCTPKENTLYEDGKSKYIETKIAWSSENIQKTRTFELDKISGRLTKYQRFMATTCSV